MVTFADAPPAGIDVVADLTKFAVRLRRREGINVHAEVIPHEHHRTVWPAAVTRGLVHLYRTDAAQRPSHEWQ